jgi:hypothetical protein
MNKSTFNGLRHGEVMLIPVSAIPDGRTLEKGDYILAHSETGHHHVLEGKQFEITELEDGRLFARILSDTPLEHHKTHDKHRTLTIPPSILERYEMVEYNPASKAIQKVRD